MAIDGCSKSKPRVKSQTVAGILIHYMFTALIVNTAMLKVTTKPTETEISTWFKPFPLYFVVFVSISSYVSHLNIVQKEWRLLEPEGQIKLNGHRANV